MIGHLFQLAVPVLKVVGCPWSVCPEMVPLQAITINPLVRHIVGERLRHVGRNDGRYYLHRFLDCFYVVRWLLVEQYVAAVPLLYHRSPLLVG